MFSKRFYVFHGALACAALLGIACAGNLGSFQVLEAKEAEKRWGILYDALTTDGAYQDDIHVRLCVSEISKVEQQVVAGTNYRFTTKACDVTKDLSQTQATTPTLKDCESFLKTCTLRDAVITIYEDFGDAVEVSLVELPDSPAKVHAVGL